MEMASWMLVKAGVCCLAARDAAAMRLRQWLLSLKNHQSSSSRVLLA